MIKKADKNKRRIARHFRQRNKISGTKARPRLNVFRSAKHIYAQVIDDVKGVTLAAASTLDEEVKTKVKGKKKTEVAGVVGELVAKRAKAAKINEVVFDRGGYLYTGRIAALADGARKAGLKF